MKLTRLLSATAVATVLAAPAMAQTTFYQFTNEPFENPNNPGYTQVIKLNQVGGFTFAEPPLNLNSLGAGDFVTSLGRQNSTEALQIQSINVNGVGAGEINGNFAIFQGAGNVFNPNGTSGGEPVGDDIYGNTVLAIVNANGLWTVNPLQSSTVVSGSQIGQIGVNTINTELGAETALGEFWQQAGTDGSLPFIQPVFGAPVGPALSVDNAMIAITNVGTADVIGRTVAPDTPEGEEPVWIDGGQQVAVVNLNSASFALGADSTVALNAIQELTANNTIAVRNIAAAVALNNGDSTIDPTVRDIDQRSIAAINSISFSTPVVGVDNGVNQYGAAQVNLYGEQLAFGRGQPFGFPDSITYVRLGNVAAAVAGEPDLGNLPLNDPGMWTADSAAGTVNITNVGQVAALQINTISNPVGTDAKDEDAVGNVSVRLGGPVLVESPKNPVPQEAFAQIFSGSDLVVVPVELAGTNIVNLMVAATGNGAANITDGSQAFVININSVDVGGTLSGALIQNAYNIGETYPDGGFQNYASVTAGGNGAAKIDGLTQAMQQSYNSVSAGTLSDIYLNQLSTDVTLGNVNTARATGSAGASLLNTIQVSTLNVNTIKAGTINTGLGMINQATTNVNLASVNTLQATGGLSSVISGAIQQSSTNINTIGIK